MAISQLHTKMSDASIMKQLYSLSQVHEILGPSVSSQQMTHYGLPCLNPTGIIAEHYQKGLVRRMIEAASIFSRDIHIVSFLENGNIVNRYEENNVEYYKLFRGNNNSSIEFVYDDAAKAQADITVKYLNQILKEWFDSTNHNKN